MPRESARVARVSAVLAVIIAFVLLGTPAMQLVDKKFSPVGEVAAANGNRNFRVGALNYADQLSTLNPFVYSSSADYETIWPCYSTLLTYDLNGNRIGDLANSWTVSPNGLFWNFTLANNAYFVDSSSPTTKNWQVTALDVIWTYWEVNNDTDNHLSRLLNNGQGGIIEEMYTGSGFDLYVQLKGPWAPFLNALCSIPIVDHTVWGHLEGYTPITYPNIPLIGSGAFYLDPGTRLPVDSQVILKANPIWFQTVNRGWQLHVDELRYVSISGATVKLGIGPDNVTPSQQPWIALTSSPPTIDVYQYVMPGEYNYNLVNRTTPGVIGWTQNTGYTIEYQLNQLTKSERAALKMTSGSNNQLLLDPTVKLAMAMCVDKQYFVDTVLMKLGTVGDSVVPDCNPWHYTVPNPVQFSTSEARQLLNNAGWAYDSAGYYDPSATPLYKWSSTNNTAYQPLEFNLETVRDSSQIFGDASLTLSQWARQAGILLNVYWVSMTRLMTDWLNGNYDTLLLGRVSTPTSDPSTDCLFPDTTMAIGTWSTSYWHNSAFDSLYNSSLVASDPVTRRNLTDLAQASVYSDHNDQIIAYSKYCYAASTYYWDASSYGNWSRHWTLLPESGLPWLYMQLSPADNLAPTTAVSIVGGYHCFMNEPVTVTGSSSQTQGVEYKWYWGDGSESEWLASATTTHTYTSDGVYTAYFAARQTGTADAFIGWNQTTVTVVDNSNLPPVLFSPAITMSPTSGIHPGTNVTFVGHAYDPNNDWCYYSWDFGDGHTGTGQIVTHSYASVGTGAWTVTMYVTDNRPGCAVQVSYQGVIITINHPPQLSIQSSRTVLKNTATLFPVTASDLDSDPLRFTWNWGDGSVSVTTSSSVTHTYTANGYFNLVVHVDDLTGADGHNVSGLEVVHVVTPATPPASVKLTASEYSIFAGQSITFTGSAKDPGGDAMTFNFTFGDGTFAVMTNPPTAKNQVVTDTIAHTYWSPGGFAAYMSAWDGMTMTSSAEVVITVTLNHAPVMPPQTVKKMWQGNSTSFSASATDQDGETIRYTWDFGDGSPMVVSRTTTHIYAKAGNYSFTVYADDLTGIAGHNVSSTAQALIAFNLALAAGYNLISVPLLGYGYNASTIGLASGDTISEWNSTTQSYGKTYIMGISTSASDFAISPSTSYWVWAGAAGTLHLYGSIPTSQQSTKLCPVPSGGGWVFLGLNSLTTTRHASDIAEMYWGAGELTSVSYYDAGSKGYKTWLAAVPTLNDFLLIPGQGYECWCTVNGALAYMP